MIKRAITTIILLQIFSAPKTVLCQHKIGSTNGIQFIFEEMKVYKTYEDYKNNNFVIAEFMDKNNFKKDKKKILEVKECWGYTIEYYSSEYIFRICDDSEYKTVLMSISGNLSLYCDGVPFWKPKTNENFILLNNFTLPMFFSLGDSGEIQKFNKENISEAVKTDNSISLQAEKIRNVGVGNKVDDYIYERIDLVQAYNKRHPRKEATFDLFAPSPNRNKE